MADVDFTGGRTELEKETLGKMLSKLNDKYEKVRENAALGLGSVSNPEAVPALAGLLGDWSKSVRRAAVHALTNIGSREAISVIVEVLMHEDAEMRGEAAHYLGMMRAYRATDALLSALLRERDVSAKEKMIEAAGWLGDVSTLPPLFRLLSDEDSGVRWSATWAIGNIGRRFTSTKAADMLLRLERHHDKRVRREAATALRMTGIRQV